MAPWSFDFNLSEYRGWKSGGALKQFVATLPESSKNIFAFSQGSTVAGAAFEQGMTAHNYVMIEAAIPAGCFDTSDSAPNYVNGYGPMLTAEANQQTPNVSPAFQTIEPGGNGLGYLGYLADLHSAGRVSGLVINVNNGNDWALATGVSTVTVHGQSISRPTNWESNQESYKPNSSVVASSYTYNAQLPAMVDRAEVAGYTGHRDVTDYDECVGFVSRPRSKAVGALNVAGGSIDLGIDTSIAPYCMGNTLSDHTAYYNRDFQTTSSLYQMLNARLTAP